MSLLNRTLSVRNVVVGLALSASIPLLFLCLLLVQRYSAAALEQSEAQLFQVADRTTATLDRDLESVELAIALSERAGSLDARLQREVELLAGARIRNRGADKSPTLTGAWLTTPGSRLASRLVRTPGGWRVLFDRREGSANLIAEVEPARLGQNLLGNNVPRGWIISIVNSEGRLIWRSKNGEQFIGELATQDLRRNTTGIRGSWSGTTLEGTKVQAVYTRSALAGYVVAVGAPEEAILAPYRNSLVLLAVFAFAALVISILLSVWFSRLLIRPMNSLAQWAKAGSLTVPPPAARSQLEEVKRLTLVFRDAHSLAVKREQEEKAAAAAIKASQEQLSRLLDEVPVAIVETDTTGAWIYANPAAEKLLELKRAEVVGRPYDAPEWGITDPTGKPITPSELPSARSLQGEIVNNYHHTIKHPKTGEILYLAVNSVPLRGVDGSVVGSIAALANVSEQYAFQAALEASEHQMRTLTDALPVLISHVDRDLRYRYLNKTYEEWFGIDRSAVIGKSLRVLLGEQTFEALLPNMLAVLSGERRTIEELARYPTGDRHIRVDYVPQQSPNGEVEGFYALIRDISEEKQREEALQDSERRMRTVLESVSDSFYAADANWRITLMNKAAESHFERGREQVLGKTIWEAFPFLIGSPYEDRFRAVMTDREPITFTEESLVKPDCFVEMRASPKEGGGIAVSFSDVTERVRSEGHRELLVNELNHRVKNTLAIVQAIAAQSFKEERVTSDARASFEGRILALAQAHNLLTAENWEAASLREVVATALRPFAAEERYQFEGGDLRLRPKAAVSLALAFHELATNAAKYGSFSSPHGRVLVQCLTDLGSEATTIQWQEEGGPPVAPPSSRGFGSRLIERGLASELSGKVMLRFDPAGLVCTISTRLSALEQQ